MNNNTHNSQQAILDNLHTAIIIIGDKLNIECMNPSAEMLFHFSSNRAHNRNIHQLIINEHEFYDRLSRTLISGHPFTRYETQLNIHNNTTVHVDFSVSPLEYKADGHFLLLEFTSLNHIQRYSQEEKLLTQHDASKALLRGLAHEIKNPLGGLRGAAQLLERELDEKNKTFTRIIINEADRLKNLVDRMVGPHELPNKTTINVHKIIEHVRQLVTAELRESLDKDKPSIKLLTDYDPSIPDLEADESMLIQVILNITRNAIAAIDKDGMIIFRTRARRHCTIGITSYPLVASIEIIDNGNGVASNLQEKIFLPMITGRADGTGLGLSIAQSLVQQHKGLIEFSSTPGETVFTILLPILLPDKRQHDAIQHGANS